MGARYWISHYFSPGPSGRVPAPWGGDASAVRPRRPRSGTRATPAAPGAAAAPAGRTARARDHDPRGCLHVLPDQRTPPATARRAPASQPARWTTGGARSTSRPRRARRGTSPLRTARRRWSRWGMPSRPPAGRGPVARSRPWGRTRCTAGGSRKARTGPFARCRPVTSRGAVEDGAAGRQMARQRLPVPAAPLSRVRGVDAGAEDNRDHRHEGAQGGDAGRPRGRAPPAPRRTACQEDGEERQRHHRGGGAVRAEGADGEGRDIRPRRRRAPSLGGAVGDSHSSPFREGIAARHRFGAALGPASGAAAASFRKPSRFPISSPAKRGYGTPRRPAMAAMRGVWVHMAAAHAAADS